MIKKIIYSCISIFYVTTISFAISISNNTWIPRSFSSYMSRQLLLEQAMFEKSCIEKQCQYNQSINSTNYDDIAYDDVLDIQHEQDELAKTKDQILNIEEELDDIKAKVNEAIDETVIIKFALLKISDKDQKTNKQEALDRALNLKNELDTIKEEVKQTKVNSVKIRNEAIKIKKESEKTSKSIYFKNNLASINKPVVAAKIIQCKETVHMLAIVAEYMKSFNTGCDSSTSLGSLPFWSGTNVLTVGNNEGTADLDAYQFGLGDVKKDSNGKTIQGSIQLDVDVQHVGAELLYYFMQKQHDKGCFFKINVPLGAMIISPRLQEVEPILFEQEDGFTQTTTSLEEITYYSVEYPTSVNRPKSLINAFYGGSSDADKLDGNILKPFRLRRGRVPFCKQEIIRLGDIGASLGYNVFANDKGFLGLALKVSCPTGNITTGDYMLEPIFGRAGVWGIGAELLGHYKVWQKNEQRYLDMAFQAEALHLMPGRRYSYRSFDLKQNGAGSKYLLVQHYLTDLITDVMSITTEVKLPGQVQQAVNITTLPVISRFAIEGAAAAMLTYHHDNWKFGLGIEGWARSQEQLTVDVRAAVDLRLSNLNEFAVLGRQKGSYLIDGQMSIVNSYYCEPLATINKSQDPVILTGMVPTVTTPTTLPEGIKDARNSVHRIPAKLEDALDICGAQAAQVSTVKIFGHCLYTAYKRKHMPMLGIAGGVEFGGKTNNIVPLWSIALQGSLLF